MLAVMDGHVHDQIRGKDSEACISHEPEAPARDRHEEFG